MTSRAESFKIDIPQIEIADLRSRLDRTRFIDSVEGADWRYGVNLDYLHEIARYWRDSFDWRAVEASLNALPQFIAQIGEQRVHFIHVRGEGRSPAPLILTHGWPSAFTEFLQVIPRLTGPSEFGGAPDDAFDVVVPSVPGFGFSPASARPGMSSRAVADLWDRLMTETLGYRRYFAQGGDIGDSVTNRMGRFHPQSVAAIHVLRAPVFEPPADVPLTPDEHTFLERMATWRVEEGGYAHQQQTRPQTLACGLNDSPVGLAAWILEKWRAWSDCGGRLETRFTKDQLLTVISIYWFTQTIASSMRIYFETTHDPNSAWPGGRIEVPARLLLSCEPVYQCPRSWAERSFADLTYDIAPSGGHFFAAEEPELLAEDLRAFFRPYRSRTA